MDCTSSQAHYETSRFSKCASDFNKKTLVSAEQKPSFSWQNVKTCKTSAQENRNFLISSNDSKNQSKTTDHLSSDKDNHLVLSRSFDRSHNNSNNVYDFGGPQEANEDSGIEMLRAFSSNSSNSGRLTPVQSCGSSLVSYSSEPEGDRCSECGSESSEKSRLRNGRDPIGQCSNNCWKSRKIYDRSLVSLKTNSCCCEGTSESCSETSSTYEAVTPDQLNRSTDFKRCVSNRLQGIKKCESGKSSILCRSESITRDSFDKIPVRSHSSLRSSSTAGRINSSSKSFSSNRNAKSTIAGKCEAKPSKTRTEDGRRSSQKTQANGTVRVASVADPSRKSLNAMSCSMTSSICGGISKSCEGNSNALEKYGTLPRRTKKKLGESQDVSLVHPPYSRSHSVTREPSLNRAATLRRQQSKEKDNASNRKSLPPYPKPRRGTCKITIYHEVSVQTVITSEDINSSSAGVFIRDKKAEVSLQKEGKGIQTEGKEKMKEIEDDYLKQRDELEAARKENERLKSEREDMVARIHKLLGLSESKEAADLKQNGLDELEKHFQAVGLTVLKQQEELSKLRHYKLIANRNLELSLATQKNLLQQQQEIETEYSELQEFLQAEKTALSESLIDTEEELRRLRDEISRNQAQMEQQQEECKHLVRICEQRRQENLSLEVKLAGLDQRSRDLLVQQGAAVSAAAVALSGLGARIDNLVEQLAASYNISNQDIEDVFYEKEVYNKSESSSLDDIQSQLWWTGISNQKESLVQIIHDAVRNTAPVFDNKNIEARKLSEPFLCTETEPLLSFENCLDENSRSFSNLTNCDGGLEDTKDENKELDYMLTRSDSLQNLSVAILNRQMAEKNEKSVALDKIIPTEVNSLVNQTVDIDNLVTKLFKVIRIIQGHSDLQKDKLQKERANLLDELCQEKLSRQERERNLQALQLELTEARCQLNLRIGQLEEAKALQLDSQRVTVGEMQKRFALIDMALGALNSAQHIVEQCPQLARLQRELKDCNHQKTQNSDVNANPDIKHFEDVKCNGAVLTTAV